MSKKHRCEKHKYQRIVLSEKTGTLVFKCVACPRFIKRELLTGEVAKCWKCGKDLTLNMENTQFAKPTHPNCRGKRIELSSGERVILPAEILRKLDIDAATSTDEMDDIDEFMKGLGL